MTTQSITWSQMGVMIAAISAISTFVGVFLPQIMNKKQNSSEGESYKALVAILDKLISLIERNREDTIEIKGTVSRTHKKSGDFETKTMEAIIDINSTLITISNSLNNVDDKVKANGTLLKDNDKALHEHMSRNKEEVLKRIKGE